MRCDVSSTILPMPEMRLFHSRAKCVRFLKSKGIPTEVNELSDAQTWTFDKDGGSYAVVLYEAGLDTEFTYDMSLMAHEAVHIATYALGSIGECEPAEEELAYTVQAIVHELVAAHFRWKEKMLGRRSEDRGHEREEDVPRP